MLQTLAKRVLVNISAIVLGVAGASCSVAGGGVSAVDREAIEAAFARADTDGDGKLSRAEAQRFPEIAARFDQLDREQDGFLTLAEFAAGATPPARP